MSALDTILGIFKTAAPVAANLVVPGSGSLVHSLVTSVVPDKDPEEAAQAILDDPALLAELKTKAMELERTIAKETTKNLSDVNETMRQELHAESWYQRAWRPFNGFMFPVALILNYIVLPVYLSPKFVAVPTIPEWALVAWAGILGVAVHGRNQEKKAASGIDSGLMAGAGKIIKKWTN